MDCAIKVPCALVALHPEGVDRNRHRNVFEPPPPQSPSTRRAWIEIMYDSNLSISALVALHPEGVDRNNMAKIDISKIDIALHPEGADRNYDWGVIAQHFEASRPPPGGRG